MSVRVAVVASAVFAGLLSCNIARANQPIKPTQRSNSHPTFEIQDNADAIYIVELADPSVAAFNQNRAKLQSITTNHKAVRSRVNTRSADVEQYRQHLRQLQDTVLKQASDKTQKIKPLARYELAYNGFAAKLSPTQASALSANKNVVSITKETIYQLNAAIGPATIGAPAIWNGDVTNSGSGLLGEGTVVAILDTGVNTDHPAFADIGGDGYDHRNPLPDGRYLGDCANGFAQLCNDKLIGVFSYPEIVSAYADSDIFPPGLPANGEDYNGHGSHVAAIAAGNRLYNVAEVTPAAGEVESGGQPTGYRYDELSGVAPHANIISYQVCQPGEEDDTYSGCPESIILRAVEDIIDANMVDVINFSISGGDYPWDTPLNEAWRNAHSAGIVLAQSAGNDGPDDYTTDKHAPWLTSVAATSHSETISYQKQLTDFIGGTFVPDPMSGGSVTKGISAAIVYAGDYTNPNDPDGDPAQCLAPFPENTFNGEIVLCDRGEIARVEKAQNVAAGGAAGYVLANVPGGDSFLANDNYIIPGIHIDADDGDTLRNWLASGTDHRATITATTASVSVDDALADRLADFSSRGPNNSISTLTPMLSAPGVNIYSAFSDQHFGHDKTTPAPADYAYLSGTSMAAPHVAGTALLIKQAHPNWSADEIRSAMMMTSTTTVSLENGETIANWFEQGAGRVRADLAIQAGLTMNETSENYRNADPQKGGDPRTLNLPAVVDERCVGDCSWTRTVTAQVAGTWTLSETAMTSGLSLSVSPQQFTLAEGESQTLTFSMNTFGLANYTWGYGNVQFQNNNAIPQHIPVAVYASNGNLPQFIEFEAHRNEDSYLLTDLLAVEINAFSYVSYGLTQATRVEGTVTLDNTPDEIFDDLDTGVAIIAVDVPTNALRLVAETLTSSASDLDLYLVYDRNGNGQPDASEVRAQSTSDNALETADIIQPDAGTWFIVIQNWQGSGARTDTFSMEYAVIDSDDEGNLSIAGPKQSDPLTAFDLRVIWDLDDAQHGDNFYGAFALGTDSTTPDNIGITYVDIHRKKDDVTLNTLSGTRLTRGATNRLSVDIISNTTPEDRQYDIEITLPNTLSLVEGSVGNNGSVQGKKISWKVTQPAVVLPDTPSTNAVDDLEFEVLVSDSAPVGPLSIDARSTVTNIPGAGTAGIKFARDIQVNGSPSVTLTQGENTTISSGGTIMLSATVDDPNNDKVSYFWEQISGPALTLNGRTDQTVSITAPNVDGDRIAMIKVTVEDSAGGRDEARISITISPNQPPVLSVNAPSSVSEGSTITVRASADDPEDDALTYTINDVPGAIYRARASGGSMTFTVTVSDGINEVTKTVQVTVTEARESGGGGTFGPWLALMLLSVIARRNVANREQR